MLQITVTLFFTNNFIMGPIRLMSLIHVDFYHPMHNSDQLSQKCQILQHQKFHHSETEEQHVKTQWKKAQKVTNARAKKHTFEHAFSFCGQYTSLVPKNSIMIEK